MNNDVLIREFKQEDVSFLESFMEEFGRYIMSIDSLKRIQHKPGGAKYFLNKMIKETQDYNGKVFVAVYENKIVGFIGGYIKMQSDEELMEDKKETQGYVSELFIEEKLREKGVGSVLMSKMEEYFITQGCEVIRLAVFSSNKPARSLYEKLGYQERSINLLKELKLK